MKILGISGKKQSGKGVASNFILGINLVNYGVVRGNFQINPDGQLSVSDIYGDENGCGILNQDYYNVSVDTLQWWQENVWPLVKIYNFADPLKQMCINILGLSYTQCYGTNEQKNSLTELKWENIPEYESLYNNYQYIQECSKGTIIESMCPKTGFMTGREVLQYVGTNIFRKMYNNVWVDATLRLIQEEQPELAIIADVRFPNEVEGIQKAGGKVIRLTRSPIEDSHNSETELDKEHFDWSKFDAVIDNAEMTIAEQNKAVYECLRPWGYIPELEE